MINYNLQNIKLQMITKHQSSPIRKRRLTPLFLLSKVKKNSDISFNRQSALSFLEQQQRKINNRYGQILRKAGPKLQSSQSLQQIASIPKQQDSNAYVQSKSALNKIQKILRKSTRRTRFHSVQKRTKTDVSPYLSQQRRRNSDESKLLAKQDPSDLQSPYNKKIQKPNRKLIQPIPISQKQKQENRSLNSGLNNASKVFIHFANLCKIDSIIQSKRTERDIIPIIRKYILEEEGDPSQLETLYSCEHIGESIKKILFIEKVLVILIVDLIINRKFKLTEPFIKAAVKLLIGFYVSIYKDLFDSHKINSEELIDIQLQALKKVIEAERSQQKKIGSFSHIFQCLYAKIKACFKYSHHIQNFYKINHKNIHSFTSNLSYFRLLEFYSLNLLGSNWVSWNIQFLQVCPSPYLHFEPKKTYTLVLDLDQTLIHYKLSNNFQGQFLLRPYLFQFLAQLNQYYELGIFTCSMPEYANLIIDHMPQIVFRLYRHHTIKLNGQYVKDLSRIGRDLSKTIIVDNLQQNFRLQKANGIHVRSWYGDRNDFTLKDISKQLIKLAQHLPEDIRRLQFRRNFS